MSSMDSMSNMMPMSMGFQNTQNTTLYSSAWTPSSTAGYAGTCIFLLLLATITRALFAGKVILEHKWRSQAFQRRYVSVQDRDTEGSRIDANPDAKTGSLVTARGVEEKVKVVQAHGREVIPFRLSVDVPRAFMVLLIAGASYLLMLAVMTMNVGYFLSILGGVFIGELGVGRYNAMGEH